MIDNFFVLSPRGDTVLAKTYRCKKDVGAHERSHTDAFFRRIKFWDEMSKSLPAADDVFDSAIVTAQVDLTSSSPMVDGGSTTGSGGTSGEEDTKNPRAKADAPPVFIMPDGLSYLHVKRNGLIFGCSTARNVSPVTVIEVRMCACDGLLILSFFCLLDFS